MRVLNGIVCLFIVISCQTNKEPVNVICSGFEIESDEIEMTGPFELDSIQYSSAKSNYILSGTLRTGSEERTFSILSESSPKSESFKIHDFTFPFRSIDSSNFECVLTYKKGVCEISWKAEGKYLYLRNSIISAH